MVLLLGLALGGVSCADAGGGDGSDPTSTPATAAASDAAATAAPTEDDAAAGGEFVAEDAGFALSLPAGWEILENEAGIRVSALRPHTAGEYETSINVTSQAVPNSLVELTIRQYARVLPQAYERQFGTIEITQRRFDTLAGQEAVVFEFTGNDRGTDVQARAVTALANGNVYSVMYFAAADEFARDLDAAEDAVTSFRLL